LDLAQAEKLVLPDIKRMSHAITFDRSFVRPLTFLDLDDERDVVTSADPVWSASAWRVSVLVLLVVSSSSSASSSATVSLGRKMPAPNWGV